MGPTSDKFFWENKFNPLQTKLKAELCQEADFALFMRQAKNIDHTDPDNTALKCLDTFFTEYVVPYIQTIDTKTPDEVQVFHIPIMTGGFYAYSDARAIIKYFSSLANIFELVSKQRYNIQVNS